MRERTDIVVRGREMKKKIAVFAGGWAGEYLQEVVSGIKEVAGKEKADVFVFVNFSTPYVDEISNIGEFNIFTLPVLEEFDGVIVMANSFNMQKERDFFAEKLKKTKCPSVSIEYRFDGVVSVSSDNYSGMYELATHVIREHGARDILFIGGPQEHMESAERLKALQDAAEESGVFLPEKNIKYAFWTKRSARVCLQEWMDETGRLPEAVLCANDIMAMGICDYLWEHQVRVPEEVLVAGYDCVCEAQEYQPSIASVNHAWRKMGEAALGMLLRMIHGEAVKDMVLNTCFVAGESCGCARNGERRMQHGGRLKNPIDALTADAHFRHIYQAIRMAETAEGLSDCLSYWFELDHTMEGEDFMLCLEPEFFQIEEEDRNLRKEGYSDRVAVVGGIQEGKRIPYANMGRKEAMFYFADRTDEPGMYFFLPVYSDTKTYGFAIQSIDLWVTCENQLYIWTRHVNENLEQVRRNITIAALMKKLTELSVTDVLTGAYNRVGCEKIAYPMLEDWRKNGGTGVIMLTDLDDMKGINDEYGHGNGDLALRTVVAVLKKELPEDWIISRFGGDEFFVGGCLKEATMDLDALCSSVKKRLVQEAKERQLPFRLTVSIGSVLVKPEETTELVQYLQMADDAMYRIKKLHHGEQEE